MSQAAVKSQSTIDKRKDTNAEVLTDASVIIPQSRSKRIRISSKRQITLPVEFYDVLNFGTEAECFISAGGLFIKPVEPDGDDLSTDILKDIVAEGFEGDALIAEFERRRKLVRPAVEAWMEEAEETSVPYSTDDFGC